MDNDDVEYIVTDQASSIEKTVERYVSELVSQKSATGKDPRNAEDPLPEFVKFSPAPTPSYIADGVSHVVSSVAACVVESPCSLNYVYVYCGVCVCT